MLLQNKSRSRPQAPVTEKSSDVEDEEATPPGVALYGLAGAVCSCAVDGAYPDSFRGRTGEIVECHPLICSEPSGQWARGNDRGIRDIWEELQYVGACIRLIRIERG
jgi:hypothetical protein